MQSRKYASLLVLAALVCACDEPSHFTPPADPDKAAAEPTGTPDFVYPLDLGNRWDYTGSFEYWVIAERDPIEHVLILSTHSHLLTQTETLFGRPYVVEERTIVEDTAPNEPIINWVRYRQDTSGLYEAEVSIVDPPGGVVAPGIAATRVAYANVQPAFDRVPTSQRGAWLAAWERLQVRRQILHGVVKNPSLAGGPLDNEITRLRYPPTVGKVFYVLPNALRVRIEAIETVSLPAGEFEAARLRLTWLFSGAENDRIHMWIGRCGILKFEYQIVSAATDDNFEVIGKLIAQEVQSLTDLDLASGGCAPAEAVLGK